MSILLIDGLDAYPAALAGSEGNLWTVYDIANQAGGWSFVPGRFGFGRALRRTPGTGSDVSVERAISEQTTIVVGFAYRGETGALQSLARSILQLRSASGIQCGLGVNTSGHLFAHQVSTGTIIATATTDEVWDHNSFVYLEVKAVIHASTGSFEVWQNGTKVINATNVNTKGQSESGVDLIRWQTPTNNWTAVQIDDIYVTNSEQFRDSFIATVRPNADTADDDWVPSQLGAENFAMVDDDQADGDNTYVLSGTPGDVDLYGHDGLPSTGIPSIHAVQVTALARRSAGSPEVRTVLKSDDTTEEGSSVAVATSYGYIHSIYTEDPDTSMAWEEAGVNAALFGFENSSS